MCSVAKTVIATREERYNVAEIHRLIRELPSTHRDRPKLARLLSLLSGGSTLEVNYCHASGISFGRQYAKGPSMQSFSRVVRNSLAPSTLRDVDMVMLFLACMRLCRCCKPETWMVLVCFR